VHKARLKKCARLLKAAEFNYVFDKAVRSGDSNFTILARSGDAGCPRLGLAISKKRARLAVTRNRLKRITRESFRLNQHLIADADYIVLAGPEAGSATHTQLFQSLQIHWQRLNKKLCATS
jgi:ribonuclease P protein component